MSLASHVSQAPRLAPEELFLITYHQNGLMRRDSWFQQAEEAHRHFANLKALFPESGVQLHVIPFDTPAISEPNPWHFLEF